MVGLGKRGLKKKLVEHPDVHWDDLIMEVVGGIRFTPSRTHGFAPAELMFK
jgi:hypothetical protein